jgi:hypothetical protein
MAKPVAENILREMHDIHGLDAVSAWPLAIGWWLLIILAAVSVIGIFFYSIRRYRYLRSWQYGSFKILQSIEEELRSGAQRDLKQILHQLAVEMRRIAMQAYTRETCAGLIGKQWLTWLEQHDPRQFAWQSNGQLLINYQYMPQVIEVDDNNIQKLINAAKQWVKKC